MHVQTLKWTWQQASSVYHELKFEPFDLNLCSIGHIGYDSNLLSIKAKEL